MSEKPDLGSLEPADLGALSTIKGKVRSEVEHAVVGVIDGEKDLYGEPSSYGSIYRYAANEAIDCICENYLDKLGTHEFAKLLLDPANLIVSVEDMGAFLNDRVVEQIIETFVDKKEQKAYLAQVKSSWQMVDQDGIPAISSGFLYQQLFTPAGRDLSWQDLLASPLRDRVLHSKRLNTQKPVVAVQRLLAERLFGPDWLGGCITQAIEAKRQVDLQQERAAAEALENEWSNLIGPKPSTAEPKHETEL